jgi:hypothetical protein
LSSQPIESGKTQLKEKRKLSLSEEDKARILNIEQTMDMIELDGSTGIHNFSNIEELLTNSVEWLKSLENN